MDGFVNPLGPGISTDGYANPLGPTINDEGNRDYMYREPAGYMPERGPGGYQNQIGTPLLPLSDPATPAYKPFQLELPKIDLPQVELQRFDPSQFEVRTYDLPRIEPMRLTEPTRFDPGQYELLRREW